MTFINESEMQLRAELNVAWHYLYIQRGAISSASIGPEHFVADVRLGIFWERCQEQVARGGNIDLLAASQGYPETYEAIDHHVAVLTPRLLAESEKLMRDGTAVHNAMIHCRDWLERAQTGEHDASELHERFHEIAAEFVVGENIDSRSGDDVAREAMDGFFDADDDRGLPVPVLDARMRKFKYDKLYLIGGLTSNHKTTYALMCAQRAAEAGGPVLFWTLEDDNKDMAERMIVSRSTLLTLDHFETGAHEVQDSTVLTEAVCIRDNPSGLPIRHEDRVMKLAKTVAYIHQQVQKHKLKMVVIDFMQLVETDDPSMGDTERQKRTVQALSRVAKDLHIVIIAVVQLTQDATKRAEDGIAPRLGDVRGGSSISQASYAVIMTNTPVEDKNAFPVNLPRDQRRIELVIRKCKRARRGAMPCIVDASHDRIWAERAGPGEA